MRRLRWALVATAAALDLASVFQDAVEVERLIDYDADAVLLDVSSSGLPQHAFDASFLPGVPVDVEIKLPDFEAAAARGLRFGGRPVPAEAVIGVAANGVAIYSYKDASGMNLVEPPFAVPGTNATARDGCYGFRTRRGAYACVAAS